MEVRAGGAWRADAAAPAFVERRGLACRGRMELLCREGEEAGTKHGPKRELFSE